VHKTREAASIASAADRARVAQLTARVRSVADLFLEFDRPASIAGNPLTVGFLDE